MHNREYQTLEPTVDSGALNEGTFAYYSSIFRISSYCSFVISPLAYLIFRILSGSSLPVVGTDCMSVRWVKLLSALVETLIVSLFHWRLVDTVLLPILLLLSPEKKKCQIGVLVEFRFHPYREPQYDVICHCHVSCHSQFLTNDG